MALMIPYVPSKSSNILCEKFSVPQVARTKSRNSLWDFSVGVRNRSEVLLKCFLRSENRERYDFK